MSKRDRHTEILDLVRERQVGSQERLRELLSGRGFDVTQATVSRDIRELRLVKVSGADGSSHYTLPEGWENTPPLETLLPTLFLGAEASRNLLVVRTMTGGAQAVALAIDWEEWPEVLGTLAGDDTILVVCREDHHPDEVAERLASIAGGGSGTPR